VVKHFAPWAVVVGLALVGAGCGASQERVASGLVVQQHLTTPVAAASRGGEVGPGPFVLGGGFAAGPGSGLWGDSASGSDGTGLGCLDARHYAYAFGIENHTKEAVMLIGARGPNPAPGIIDRVAIQLRLAPPAPKVSPLVLSPPVASALHRWSARPAMALMIPPGRGATVQSNFLMRNCKDLAPGRTVVVPGSLVLSYRTSGHAHRQEIGQRGARIILTRGPAKRRCDPVSGSASFVAADTGCNAARQAALACHPMSHASWGDCTVAGVLWDCGSIAGAGYPYLEECNLPTQKSHWFRVRWNPPILSGRAIGGVRFGLPRAKAIAGLSRLFGTRSRSFNSPGCGPAYTEVPWQHLYAEFRRGRLAGFRYAEDGWPASRYGERQVTSDQPPLVTSRKITLGSTLGQARAAYGHLKPIGTNRWQTPDGLVLYDNTTNYPDPPSSRIIEIKLSTCGDF
jgi:hypothetical protein